MATTTDEPDFTKLEKIRALLDKAESTATTFPDEAEALTAKAIELMERYRIDEAMIADAAPLQDRGKIIEIEFSVGAGPYVNARVDLAHQIAMAHSVKCLTSTGYSGKTVYLIGYETDVALTEMLYTSLLVQATSALANPEVRASKPGYQNAKTFARSFLFSFSQHIGQRLRESGVEAASAVDSTNEGQRSVALVLADRRADVEADVLRRYGKLRAARPSGGAASSEGYAAGRQAANQADLSTNRRVTTNRAKAISS